MAKKSKSRTSAADLHTAELKKHSRELKKHADALATHTLAMMMTTPVDAHKLVYSILSEFSATPLTDATKLSDLGFDVPALAGLADTGLHDRRRRCNCRFSSQTVRRRPCVAYQAFLLA